MKIDGFKFFEALWAGNVAGLQASFTEVLGYAPLAHQIQNMLGSFAALKKGCPDIDLTSANYYTLGLRPRKTRFWSSDEDVMDEDTHQALKKEAFMPRIEILLGKPKADFYTWNAEFGEFNWICQDEQDECHSGELPGFEEYQESRGYYD